MSDPDTDDIWPTTAERKAAQEQARALREAAAAGGLKFEAYLPPELALWLLDRVEKGDFHDPSEAAFVLLGEAKELEPHEDLRSELLKRSLGVAIAQADAGESLPGDEVMRALKEKFSKPLPEPARWNVAESVVGAVHDPERE